MNPDRVKDNKALLSFKQIQIYRLREHVRIVKYEIETLS